MSDREFTAEDLHAGSVLLPGQRATAKELLASIARRYGLLAADIKGPRRHPLLVTARRELYLALRAQGWSYPMIGRLVDRDHTTVLKACEPEVKMEERRLRSRMYARGCKVNGS